MKRRPPQTASEVALRSSSSTPELVLEAVRKGLYTPASAQGLEGETAGISAGNIGSELNKIRLTEALEDPVEAGQVAREFIRHSSSEAKYLGAGVESVAFSLGGGKVGKISMRAGKTGFQGFTPPRKLARDILRPISRSSFKHTTVEITSEAQLGGRADDLAAMDIRARLRKRGYEWHDAAARNVGVHEGRVKVIDYGHIRKSKLYQRVKDYGLKKGFEAQEIADLVRRRSRSTIAIQASDAAELKNVIDVAAANRRMKVVESVKNAREATRAVMKTGATRSGAGLVSNFIVRAAKTL